MTIDLATPLSVDQFIAGLQPALPDDIAAARARSDAAGLPAISVSIEQGRFLSLLAAATGARRVLEVGTLGGVSALWMARALPEDGQVHTIEVDPAHARVAQQNFSASPHGSRCVLHLDEAAKALARWVAQGVAPFDLAFIDADKKNNVRYTEAALTLARPGSLIVVDNVIRGGRIIDAACTDENTQGARDVLAWLGAHPRLELAVLQTVGEKGYDGFAIARVRT